MTSKKVILWWTLYSAEENEFGGETVAKETMAKEKIAKETMAKAISCRSPIHTLVCAAKCKRQNNFMKIHVMGASSHHGLRAHCFDLMAKEKGPKKQFHTNSSIFEGKS